MKILVFTEGTVTVHGLSKRKTREEIVKESKWASIKKDILNILFKINDYGKKPGEIYDFAGYIPFGEAVAKLKQWKLQGATLYYLTSRRMGQEIGQVKDVLKKSDFPDRENLLFRKEGEDYKDVAQQLMPDIFIEDDCESIGGIREMTSTHFNPEAKKKIKTIVIKEFSGIDYLPDSLDDLKKY